MPLIIERQVFFLIKEEKLREAGTARKTSLCFFQQGDTNGKDSNRTRTTGAIVKKEVPSGKRDLP